MEQLEIAIKASRAKALASLIRIFGDFELAEEAVQEATYRAVVDWQAKGIPLNPVAWLVQTGRHYANDRLRHQSMAKGHHLKALPLQVEITDQDDDEAMSKLDLPDDLLRLIFTCCHPALSQDAQVVLTLKTIAGLSVEEISRAYLSNHKTVEQRLTRAKRKIRDAAIPYQVPDIQKLDERLDAVMNVLYLIYNQAYTALKGPELLDRQLSEVAISLARMLNRLITDASEVQGLLALMLLQHARAEARTDAQGAPVSLDQQDRSLWDQKMIAEGLVMLDKSLRRDRSVSFRQRQLKPESKLPLPGRYCLQAAIAAVHCRADKAEDTDWQEIVELYELLQQVMPGPVISLNRAIALSRWQGAEAGLTVLDSLIEDKHLTRFQYFHSARAALLEETGDFVAAVAAYIEARKCCSNEAEGEYLTSRIRALKKQLIDTDA